MKSKQGLLKALRAQIAQLEALEDQIENSEEPDLRPVQDLGEIVETRREALSLSAEDVAELCGASATTIRAIEKGTGNPTLKTLTGIGNVLNLKLWIELK
ncbi:helix-turn-helix domain-containing protein [Marinobacter goseongensis]|uniref:helix-turn-helix domain-containing protein n=1 Tax=Marinobacter goseongensis TaxID=453838 RepID=UPI0020067A48|nr:helix-turn-helix transcriptional regulator [Marinobacter goseongensis]MCK7552821.1 helix-turn-helix domain-containing protein [Marinobacter goseongensis]